MLDLTDLTEGQTMSRKEEASVHEPTAGTDKLVIGRHIIREPAKQRPKVEGYDPHFGSHLMKKDSFWRI